MLAGRLADWIADWLGWLYGLTSWASPKNELEMLFKGKRMN